MIEVNYDLGEYEEYITQDTLDNIQKVCDKILESENIKGNFEVSLSFVNDEEIRELNNEYRQIDAKTDVLSFPLIEIEEFNDLKEHEPMIPVLLGDIIISLPTALEQSKEYNHSLNREISFLTCHSMFHLLGYDHIEESEAEAMELKQEEILSQLGITRLD